MVKLGQMFRVDTIKTKNNTPTQRLRFICGQLQLLTGNSSPPNCGMLMMGSERPLRQAVVVSSEKRLARRFGALEVERE